MTSTIKVGTSVCSGRSESPSFPGCAGYSGAFPTGFV